MSNFDEARTSEHHLVLFDVIAGLAVLTSPLLFGAVEPAPTAADPRALMAVVAVTIAAVGGLIWARSRRARDMDEFVQRTFERACGSAFFVTLITHILWSRAERALWVRPMSAQDAAAVLVIGTGLAWFWYRYRGTPG